MKIIKSYAHAESQLIKAKLMYNNLDRYISVRQTEVKRDLTLAGKQEDNKIPYVDIAPSRFNYIT